MRFIRITKNVPCEKARTSKNLISMGGKEEEEHTHTKCLNFEVRKARACDHKKVA